MFGSLQVWPPSCETLTTIPDAGLTRLNTMFA